MFDYTTAYESYDQFVVDTDYYIQMLFRYYNGRINILNKAVLHIDYAMIMSSESLGTTTNPNIVTIYVGIIRRFASDAFEFYYMICETIIHELFHCDQDIDFTRMKYDERYRDMIEFAVEQQTTLYIATHLNEIAEFGLAIDPGYTRFRLDWCNKLPYSPYHRKFYVDQILFTFTEMIQTTLSDRKITELRGDFLEVLNDPKGEFVFKFNGKVLVVKDKDYTIDLETYNNRVYEYFFKYNYRRSGVEYTRDDNVIIIDITNDGSNVMCTMKGERINEI